jgi:ABC-type transporter Mla subunit MlaD
MRKLAWVLIIAAGLACLGTLPVLKHSRYSLHLRTYFRQGNGLQAGAPVRVDGVGVGSVRSVRVRPELGERPVEVLMTVSTDYQLDIPGDATVSLLTDGVLGPTFADIDTRKFHGTPVADNGTLNSVELTDAQNASAIQRLSEALNQASRKDSSAVQK